MRRKLAAGNWKMNGRAADLAELAPLPAPQDIDVLICPPATLLSRAAMAAPHLSFGGQDCHPADTGAHTGDISAAMLADAGASYVILGHSERRSDHAERDALIQYKVNAARQAGLVPILCVGETRDQRDAGTAPRIVADQIAAGLPPDIETVVVAYEPVWAIGSGATPTLDEIADMHRQIRQTLAAHLTPDVAAATRLLYGGSVKPGNAADIFAIDDVDGALVGGASLRAEDFGPIITALAAS